MDTVFEFDAMIAFGFLSAMLLIGIALRAKIKFLQKYLFPSCFIGGLIGMVLQNTGVINIAPSLFENFAYHFFNISFISVGFIKNSEEEVAASKDKSVVKGAAWLAVVQGITFPLQAIIGGAFVILFNMFGMNLFKTFGFLVPLGFNEGPGQAVTFGKVWEGMGFEYGATIGMTFASLGFFFAFFVGVPLANWGIRKGLAANANAGLSPEILSGVVTDKQKRESAGELTMHSTNVDTLAFQTALIGFVYIVTYFLLNFVARFLSSNDAKMLWGFFFIFGMLIAMLVNRTMQKLGIDRYIDPGIQRRLTGFSVDYLLLATIAGIQLMVVWKFILPIFFMSFVSGFATLAALFYFGRRLWSYNLERMAAIYGVTTGTLSAGLLVLRIIDPEFKTPIAVELGIMNAFAIPVIFPCILLASKTAATNISLPLSLAIYAGIMLVSYVLMRSLKLIDTPKF